MSFKICIFQLHILSSSIIFDFAWLNTKIRYHTSHQWTFGFTHVLLQVPSSILAQLWYFLHYFPSEFQNISIKIPYVSLLPKLRFACLNTKMRYHMSRLWTFSFTYALLQVLSSILAQRWYYLHTSPSKFQNLYFEILYSSLFHKLRFACLNIKIRYHTSHLWTFWFTHAVLYVPSSIVAQLWYFLHNLPSEFQNLQF